MPPLAVVLAVAALTWLPGAVALKSGVRPVSRTTVPQLVESIDGGGRAGVEVSPAALFMLLAGQALWELTYGLTRPDLPMIVANVVAVTVTSSLIVVGVPSSCEGVMARSVGLTDNRWRSVQPLGQPRSAQLQPLYASPTLSLTPPPERPRLTCWITHTRWRSVQPLDKPRSAQVQTFGA